MVLIYMHHETTEVDSMTLFKGVFWYVPNKKRLITVKVACDENGKAFDSYDYHHDLCFDKCMGYGSTHDLERVRLNLCCDCFDKILDWVLPQCKINPITNWQGESL